MPMAELYDLFQRGMELLEAGDFNAATIPLAKARDLDPDKASIREALGRGGGPIGRLRAWWALPPRPSMPSARRRTIDAHG